MKSLRNKIIALVLAFSIFVPTQAHALTLLVWTRDDATGILDEEFKDGDVFQAKEDADPLGNQEKKSFLIIRIPDPPNKSAIKEALVRSEYAPGPTSGEDNLVRRARIYTVNWRSKFTADEVAIIEDAQQQLPDGDDVTDGVVFNKFTINDFSRK